MEPHLTNQSIVLLHDALPGYVFGSDGPHKALHSLSSDEWEFATVPVCQGLTILRKLHSGRHDPSRSHGARNIAMHVGTFYLQNNAPKGFA